MSPLGPPRGGLGPCGPSGGPPGPSGPPGPRRCISASRSRCSGVRIFSSFAGLRFASHGSACPDRSSAAVLRGRAAASAVARRQRQGLRPAAADRGADHHRRGLEVHADAVRHDRGGRRGPSSSSKLGGPRRPRGPSSSAPGPPRGPRRLVGAIAARRSRGWSRGPSSSRRAAPLPSPSLSSFFNDSLALAISSEESVPS